MPSKHTYASVDRGDPLASPAERASARFTLDSQLNEDELEGYEMKDFARPRWEGDEGSTTGGAEEDEDDDGLDVPLAGGRHTRRRTSVQSFELYTPDEERRVRRKLDTRLVLFVALLYMLSFLDRSNIGNAKTAGLASDLKLSDDQFAWLLTAFYMTYIAFEWMTLCYKIFPPHIYISCCVCAWGILASLQALAASFPVMLVLRALLGIGEAAFVGVPVYLSFFFRRNELALRTGIFIAAAPLATSFASSLAYGIMRFGDKTSIASWRLLFLLEGFPACLIAVSAWYWIPDSPGTARWLNRRERKIASLRMRNELAQDSNSAHEKPPLSPSSLPRHKQKLQWSAVFSTLVDPKSYLTAGMFFSCNVAFSSMPVFLPSILTAMGYTALHAQALSAPPFLFAFVSVLITAFLSDRLNSRSLPLLFHTTLAALGYLFLAFAGTFQLSSVARYIAVFPICAGFFSAITLIITWTVNNQSSDEGKGTGVAMLNVIGQMGPLIGTRLYPDAEAPAYVKGMSVCAGFMMLAGVLAFALRVVLRKQNRRMLSEKSGRVSEVDFVFLT